MFPSLFTTVKKKTIAFLSSLLVIVLAYAFIQYRQTATQNYTYMPYTTPTPISSQTLLSYTVSKQGYPISYPSNWSKVSDISTTDPVSSFTYTENGKTYTFTVSRDRREIEVSFTNADKIVSEVVEYGHRHFLRRTWYHQEVPFYIEVYPDETNFTFYSFSIELPPTNTERYIAIFNQILSRMQIPTESQGSLTPAPTVFGPTTEYFPPK